jgi:hypothetical protein
MISFFTLLTDDFQINVYNISSISLIISIHCTRVWKCNKLIYILLFWLLSPHGSGDSFSTIVNGRIFLSSIDINKLSCGGSGYIEQVIESVTRGSQEPVSA